MGTRSTWGREHERSDDRKGDDQVARALRERFPKLSWSTSPRAGSDPI